MSNRDVDPAKGEPLRIHNVDGEVVEIWPGEWTPNPLGLPSESKCPVEVLGVDGEALWVIDAVGQLRRIEATPFGQATIQSLFGDRQGWLYWAFPRFKKAYTDEDGNDLWAVDAWRAQTVRVAAARSRARRRRLGRHDRALRAGPCAALRSKR